MLTKSGSVSSRTKDPYPRPIMLDQSNLSATLKDGVLSISIPKRASAKPIKIQVGNGSTQAAQGVRAVNGNLAEQRRAQARKAIEA
jgi:hypothetical protein